MRDFFRLFYFSGLFLSGCFVMLSFQNCSNDVGFDERPSVDRTANPEPGEIGTGQAVGGDGDVVIRFNEVPTDTTLANGDTAVDYEVSTPNGTIVDVLCLLNGETVNCGSSSRIPISNPPLGENRFEITATNTGGDTVTEVIVWTVYQNLTRMTRSINVDEVGSQVDIVINVDNSGSMLEEQTKMSEKIANFMAPFAGLDYNIAITTTSPIGDSFVWKESLNYVDGKFIPLKDSNGVETNEYCIRSSAPGMTTGKAQDLISANVVRDLYLRDDNGDIIYQTFVDSNGTIQIQRDGNGNPIPRAEGNGWERGIFTTYRAFERDLGLAGSQVDGSCMRQDVPKHVILISDERETLFEPKRDPAEVTRWLGDLDKSNSVNLRNLVSSGYGANTVFKFHSIIVNPYTQEGIDCLNGAGARPGVEYAQLSLDTGGYIGSVCAADYSTQLGQIGQLISTSELSYPLGCVAIAVNGSKGVVKDSNGVVISNQYNFNGDKVEFTQPLPAGDYVAEFSCYQ